MRPVSLPLTPDPQHARRGAALRRVAAGMTVAASLTLVGCDARTPDAHPGTDTTLPAAAAAPATPADSSAVLPAGAKQLTLAVGGMSCESCERTIAVMLRRTVGVHSAQVSVDRGEAVVTFDPARTSPTALIAVVRQLGYRATERGA